MSELYDSLIGFGIPAVVIDAVRLVLKIACVLLVTVIVYTIIKNAISFALNKKFKESATQNKLTTINALLMNIIKVVLIFCAAMVILNYFNVDISSILVITGVGGVAIGFAVQGIVKDVITGTFLWLEDQINIGDLVTINGKEGIIDGFSFRTTKIRSFDGDLHIISNGDIRMVTNKSREYRKVVLSIAFAYDNNIDKAAAVLTGVLEEIKKNVDGVLGEAEIIKINSFDGTTVEFGYFVKCAPEKSYHVESECLRIVREKFIEAGL